MKRSQLTEYTPVSARPVKSFFVSMLTRDIKLEEAILDLLDNCVDGVLRATKSGRSRAKPYRGFWSEIRFDKRSFSIADNCGGIPWDLHEYAFRMGSAPDRKTEVPGTVGVYGIGMKRAMFKIGESCVISTKNGRDSYEVRITPAWMSDEEEWDIPVSAAKAPATEDGTTIVVGDLRGGIQKRFSEDAKAFTAELERMVATHYAFIIDKGFEVRINGKPVKPRPTQLIFHKGSGRAPAIRPFIFRAKTPDGVEVFLAVGFTRPIPSVDEVQGEQEEKKYSSLDAGWTVVCNDRAVLYCDRSELTGWGEAGVPRYHTQFIAISGIVEFRSDDASKLPTTTTKRGIDASSSLYLQTKNKMREGMRIFTDYTNRWKGRAEESKRQIEAGRPLLFEEIKHEARNLPFAPTTKSVPVGEQYKPALPLPAKLEPKKRRVSFVKDEEEVRIVGRYILRDPDAEPSVVGEKCFDLVLKEAKR